MKSWKKKMTSLAVSAAMLTGFSAAALADEVLIAPNPAAQSAVAMQLDGKALTLTNGAAPIINEESGRVYLPFRSLFETLGAEVTYDENTGLITAVKGEREVQFINGQSTVVVKENGKSEMKNTMAAPYVENGQTMVPVRFAGEALGYAIGWDSANKTVVMLNPKTLADKYAGEFTYLQKYLDLNASYANKTLAYDAVANVYIIDPGSEDMPANYGELQMLMEGVTEANGNSAIKMTMADSDKLTGSMNLAAQGYSRQVMLEQGQIDLDLLMDMENLMMYIKSPVLGELTGIQSENDVWLSMDLHDLGISDKMIKDAMAQQGQITTVGDFIEYFLSMIDVTSVDDYAMLDSGLQMAVQYIGDDAFAADGNTYTADVEGAKVEFTLDDKGAMTSYSVDGSFDGVKFIMSGDADKIYLFFEINDYGYIVGMDMDMAWKEAVNSTVKVNPVDYDQEAVIAPMM